MGVIAETLVDIRLHKIMSFFKGTPPPEPPSSPPSSVSDGEMYQGAVKRISGRLTEVSECELALADGPSV
jgi:hypothetical protein